MSPMQHGTRTMYAHGKCRCPACVEANREYSRRYQAAHYSRRKEVMHFNGLLLQAWRERKQLSLRELAKRLKVSAATVSRWENGEDTPRPGTVSDIARVLRVRKELLMLKGSHDERNATSRTEAAD